MAGGGTLRRMSNGERREGKRMAMTRERLPGTAGEHALQERDGTTARAHAFYREQLLDHLIPSMQQFIARMEMVFVATTDAGGACDCSFRAGSPGFVRVLDPHTLAYPEYRGNGVKASQGNIAENPHIGLLFLDFFDSAVGLHVNGSARLVENEEMRNRPGVPADVAAEITVLGGRRPERWVVVAVEEAYIHCSKHVPLLGRRDKMVVWGSDDPRLKGGDYFGVRAQQRREWGDAAGSER